MSKRLLSAALIAGLGLAFVPGANAATSTDGTITINGLVLNQTCTINGNAKDFSVTLPTVKTSDFSSSDTTGATKFDIKLTNCPTGADFAPLKVSAYFSSATTVDGSTGFLKDNASASDNGVSIELLDNTSTPIDLRKPAATQNNEVVTVNDSTGGATLTYYAQYHKTNAAIAVTAGRVTTTVDYTINYL